MTMHAMIHAVLHSPPLRPSSLRPDLPTELEAVLLRCLEKDPAARFQSMTALRDALAPFGSQQTRPAPTSEVTARTVTPPARRGRRAIGAAGVLLMGALGVCSDTSPSECVSCVDDEHCPGPGGHCGLGQCFSCFDGVENGGEWGVDCGGPCKGCPGNFCASPDECLSGFCVDGSCCNTLCNDICAACNLLEAPGDCTALPKYSHDWDPPCNGQYVCTGGGGVCALRSSEICMSAVQCASGRCEDLHCVNLPGEACNIPQDCFMLSCVNGACTM